MKRLVVASGVGALACVCLAAASGSAMARPSEGKLVAGPISGKQHVHVHQSNSTNWSGYAAYGDTFKHVTGTWVQPTADCSGVKGRRETIASFWAGLDGYTSSTVEQTGVDAICVGATAHYVPWYEFYPAPAVTIPHTVSPGDTLTADVSVSGGTVTTTLTDSSGWSYQGQASAAGLALNSAEWITEAPAHLLTNFGTVHFASASATDSVGTADGIDHGPWSYDGIILVSHNGRTMRAQPENLSTSGRASSLTTSGTTSE